MSYKVTNMVAMDYHGARSVTIDQIMEECLINLWPGKAGALLASDPPFPKS